MNVRPRILLGVLLAAMLLGCSPATRVTPSATPQPTPPTAATLTLVKMVDRPQAAPGEALQYTLIIINDMLGGLDPGISVAISDPLPDGLEWVADDPQSPGRYDALARTWSWAGAVPRGGSLRLTLSVRLRGDVSVGTQLTNVAQASDALGRILQASASLSVHAPPATPSPLPKGTVAMATPTVPLTPRVLATPSATPTATVTHRQTALPSPASTPPPADAPYVKSLVVTPHDPPIYYLVVGSELQRSNDRGQSWQRERTPGLPSPVSVQFVAADYRHPDMLYLATDQGLYRREGAEQAWELVNTLRVTALAVDLENSDVLWAGIPYETAMRAVIVKSSDRGRTWSKADFGIGSGWVGAILINPRNPNVLWAHVRPQTRGDWPRGYVYRGGRDGSWERLRLGEFEFVASANPFAGQNARSCFVSGLAFDPEQQALYAGCDVSWYNGFDRTQRLIRSLNADDPNSSAVRWEVAAEFGPAFSLQTAGVRPLAVDARQPKALFVALDVTQQFEQPRYLLLSSGDDGETWLELHTVSAIP